MRDYVFRFDVDDEDHAHGLASRLEDRLWGAGVTFDRWTMRLTVTGDTEDDALKLARAAVRAATKDTEFYCEPLAD